MDFALSLPSVWRACSQPTTPRAEATFLFLPRKICAPLYEKLVLVFLSKAKPGLVHYVQSLSIM